MLRPFLRIQIDPLDDAVKVIMHLMHAACSIVLLDLAIVPFAVKRPQYKDRLANERLR